MILMWAPAWRTKPSRAFPTARTPRRRTRSPILRRASSAADTGQWRRNVCRHHDQRKESRPHHLRPARSGCDEVLRAVHAGGDAQDASDPPEDVQQSANQRDLTCPHSWNVSFRAAIRPTTDTGGQRPGRVALTITGSLPIQACHTLGFTTNSQMKCATFAMFVLSGRARLLTSPS